MRGVLHFHAETGTEGGYWAFQDRDYITENTTRFSCTKCHRYWDKEKHPNGPPPVSPAARLSEEEREILNVPDFCPEGEHTFKLVSPRNWSYEGLHILEDGDYLIILDKEKFGEIIWQGEISLKQFDLFTEDVHGFWIHSEQEGAHRETWAYYFFKEYPAKLTKKNSR